MERAGQTPRPVGGGFRCWFSELSPARCRVALVTPSWRIHLLVYCAVEAMSSRPAPVRGKVERWKLLSGFTNHSDGRTGGRGREKRWALNETCCGLENTAAVVRGCEAIRGRPCVSHGGCSLYFRAVSVHSVMQ